MALRVGILRNAGGIDSTKGGVTSLKQGATSCILLGVPGPISDALTDDDVSPNEIVLTLVRRTICGREYIHAVPRGTAHHTMFGGNFIHSSDSRFADICPYPIPVHDRFE